MLKATGIVRKVDMLGRIAIPAELRRTMKIDATDALEIYTDGERIVLQKYEPGCCICSGIKNDMIPQAGKQFCPDCIKQLMKQAKLDQVISRR